jgi:GR25 family glycosyltransferase involved in LPS biosynthesis
VKVKLTDIPVYYVNLEGEDVKRENTESMLKNLGFKEVHRFDAIRHDAGRIVGCARSHHAILSMGIKPPFIILEDDCAINRKFKNEIVVPDDADALYLGISHWGRYIGHSGPFVHTTKVDNEIVRVYNMLATHAIAYFSQEYIDICKRVSYHHGYEIEDHLDIGFAEIHKLYNVYSFDDPIFRQFEWNAVTTGRISEHSYNKRKAHVLYDAVLTDEESYYRIENTHFRSPIKHLIMKRDVSGIPGMFLPTKIL